MSQDFFFLFLLNLTSLTGTFPTHSLVTLPGAAVSQGDKLHEPEFREHHLNRSRLLSVSRQAAKQPKPAHCVKGQVGRTEASSRQLQLGSVAGRLTGRPLQGDTPRPADHPSAGGPQGVLDTQNQSPTIELCHQKKLVVP